MLLLFQYNWQVRNEWFDWCNQLSVEELQCNRVGGMGCILGNLFHIVNVEREWFRGLQEKPELLYRFDDYNSLDAIRELSDRCIQEHMEYIINWNDEIEEKRLYGFSYAEVIRHVIAHEIHHIGQLSVWSRELGLKPISTNLVGRGLR